MVKNITILGGGVSGLAAAYELLKRGHTVKVIEKSRQWWVGKDYRVVRQTH